MVDSDLQDKLYLKVGPLLRSKPVRVVAAAIIAVLIFTLLTYGSRWNLTTFHFDYARCPTSMSSSQNVDWSRYAYTQYVTNAHYLCNSVMLFEILHRLGSKADRLMMYPASMHPDPTSANVNSDLLLKAQKEYGVKLMPIEVQHHSGGDSTWADSFTKLLAFNQTQYQRVLSLDSDSTILQHMDELFLLPECPVAMPRAYWLDKPYLSSQIVLIQPSAQEFARVKEEIDNVKDGDFDMEIVNHLYANDCMILPHRRYDLLTGEFRSQGLHTNYIGNTYERWDPEEMLKEAKFLHFSDWPVPKPWLSSSETLMNEKQPKCDMVGDEEDCRARDLWLGFYSDFRERRKHVCGMEVNKMKPRSVGGGLTPRPHEFVL